MSAIFCGDNPLWFIGHLSCSILMLPRINRQSHKKPPDAAKWRGVFPALSIGFFSSIFSMISIQMLRCPFVAARCKGVFPEVVDPFGFLSFCSAISMRATSKWPFAAAMWSGVNPILFARFHGWFPFWRPRSWSCHAEQTISKRIFVAGIDQN